MFLVVFELLEGLNLPLGSFNLLRIMLNILIVVCLVGLPLDLSLLLFHKPLLNLSDSRIVLVLFLLGQN